MTGQDRTGHVLVDKAELATSGGYVDSKLDTRVEWQRTELSGQ